MKDHHYFEKYVRHFKMRPQGYVDTDLGRVLLADSEDPIAEQGRIFYRTAFCIDRGGLDLASKAEYEWNETGGSHSEKQTRLQQAVDHAYVTLTQLHASGYYDDAKKADFSEIPAH